MPVVAKQTCRIAGKRAKTLIVKGRVYGDDDPVVRARPELFEPVAKHQQRTTPPRGTPELGNRSMSARKRGTSADAVETARAAPGEQRDMRYSCTVDGCNGHTSERAAKNHAKKANE